MILTDAPPSLTPGARLARGVARMLWGRGFVSLAELPVGRGLRVDLMALGPKGEIWIVECKSCRADFRADAKWQGYLEWCDRFFWAVDADFPDEILPTTGGLIRADGWDAEILRLPEAAPLAGARRSALTRSFARAAAARLHGRAEPDGVGG